MKRVRVRFISKSRYDDWKIGDTGHIDGYCRGGDDIPYAIVIVKDRIVMVPLVAIRVMNGGVGNMKTIEERAKLVSEGYDDDGYSAGLYMRYVEGATEQKEIDIEKACEWLMNYFVFEHEAMSAADCDAFLHKLRKALFNRGVIKRKIMYSIESVWHNYCLF